LSLGCLVLYDVIPGYVDFLREHMPYRAVAISQLIFKWSICWHDTIFRY